MKRTRTARSGLTMIELLGIMLILTIVLAMLLPVRRTITRAAMEHEAETRGRALLHAVQEYKRVYRQWPGQTQQVHDVIYESTNDFPRLLSALTNNPRGHALLDVEGGVVSNDCLVDPWRLPYVVGLDENQDGVVELVLTNGAVNVTTNIEASAVVMSWGYLPSDPERHLFLWNQ